VPGGILLQNQVKRGGMLLQIPSRPSRWWRHHPAKRVAACSCKNLLSSGGMLLQTGTLPNLVPICELRRVLVSSTYRTL